MCRFTDADGVVRRMEEELVRRQACLRRRGRVLLYLAGEHSERRRVHDIATSGCHFEALRADAKHTDAPLDI
jgi:hypothetical protein